jgi:site-specific DNA-cytosine methylase
LESIIQQPKDKEILLKDILETDVDEKYFLSEKMIAGLIAKDSYSECKQIGMLSNETYNDFSRRVYSTDAKARTIMGSGGNLNDKAGQYLITNINSLDVRDKEFTGLDLNAKSRTIRSGGSATATDKHNWDLIVHSTFGRTSTNGNGGSGHLSKDGDKSYCLDAANSMAVEIKNNYIQWDSSGKGNNSQGERAYFENGKSGTLSSGSENSGQVQPKVLITNATELREVKQLNPSTESGGNQPYQQNRVYDVNGISPALCAQLPKGSTMINTSRIRRLTPIECERLQTVADNYTAHVSDSQRYKMLGNGWTIDVIAHIFSYLTNNL